MAVKHINLVEMTCDLCGRTFSDMERAQNATIELHGNSLEGKNYQIGPIYQAGKFDVCNECLEAFRVFIKSRRGKA